MTAKKKKKKTQKKKGLHELSFVPIKLVVVCDNEVVAFAGRLEGGFHCNVILKALI